jgi:two-component system sensor histidine kinase YesM
MILLRKWQIEIKNINDKENEIQKNQILLSDRQAELLALQNQINPHFLYNTLEAIRGDALKAGNKNIAAITEALSTYFRYTISETRSKVPLIEELENIENYFQIQQYRFGEKLQMKIDILCDNSVLEVYCLKLMLQPIIENAIFHGLEKIRDGGLIEIRIEKIDNKLKIIIQDNGTGMDEVSLKKLNEDLRSNNQIPNKKHGIALLNVNRRIQLVFGPKYGISVFSIPDIGTSVIVEIPTGTTDEA